MDPSALSISTLLAPLVGIASKLLVNWLKNAPWFNLLAKNDGKFRKHLVVLVVVTILTIAVAILTGSLSENMLQEALLLLVNVAAGHGAAVTTHELTTERPETMHELVNEGP